MRLQQVTPIVLRHYVSCWECLKTKRSKKHKLRTQGDKTEGDRGVGQPHVPSPDGIGISDIETARKPFFTTKSEQERSGMGFMVMESFIDGLEVENRPEGGLKVTMFKFIGRG